MQDRPVFERLAADADFRKLFEREALSTEATEAIASLMNRRGVTKAALAEMLGSSRAHISQLLNGSRNMTLHTLSDVLFVLGYRARIEVAPLESESIDQTKSAA